MSDKGPQTGFSAARFAGPCWVVAMDDDLWQKFCKVVPPNANIRLSIKLEYLAAHGEADMPRPRIRLQPDPSSPGAFLGSIEALGTVLSGRVSTVEGRRHLFVRSITIDPTEEKPVSRRRSVKAADDRQGTLKFKKEDQ